MRWEVSRYHSQWNEEAGTMKYDSPGIAPNFSCNVICPWAMPVNATQFHFRAEKLPYQKSKMEQKLYLYCEFSRQNSGQCDSNERRLMCDLIFGDWKLGHRTGSCFAKKSALNRFALLSSSFGKSLQPWLSNLGSLFSIQFWQNMNDLHIEDKGQHKGKYCWSIGKSRSRFSWKSRLRARMKEEIKFYKTSYPLGVAGKVFQ